MSPEVRVRQGISLDASRMSFMDFVVSNWVTKDAYRCQLCGAKEFANDGLQERLKSQFREPLSNVLETKRSPNVG